MLKWVKVAALAVLAMVILAFALMGYLGATRGTPTREVVALNDPAGLPAIGDTLFQRSIQLLTNTELRAGHQVELLYDGNGTYPRIWQDLRKAQQTALLQLYFCKPGAVADSLKHVLREVAARGVKVLALFDAFGCNLGDGYLDSLRSTGVRAAHFRPVKWYTLHKAQNRAHTRIVVIDGTVAYTGGFGIADFWLGDGHRSDQWRETNVRFTGPAVRQMQAAFATGWADATGELLTGQQLFRAYSAADSGSVSAGLLHAQPVVGSTAAERYLALTISGARRRLYITNSYFIPDDDFRRMLKVAARRGVDVRILTAGKETDVKSARLASRRHYEELMGAGIRIYEYRPTMVHAKTIVADDRWATVGTMNFDNRSLAFNEETNLLIDDVSVAGMLAAKFIEDLKYSDEIDAREFARRSILSKALERIVSGVAKML
jgi:cardiolipin synthase